EFVQLKVDVIVTTGAAALAAKQTTSVIPIVFAVANDPIGSGLIAGLARPGGNVTGLSVQARDLAGKRLEFLREVLTDLRRLAILANVGAPLCWKWAKPRLRPARSVSKSSHWKSGEPRISRPPWRLSRVARRRFTLLAQTRF